ncbi:hypothetical protein SKAU_G00419080 [Synaphobranchus kaupii]|uniref:Uncharacterized protein n=1 Tax=Synaphobranchus kaupii TaxID=118154 RepID=A0A9Q1E6A1_SYNKA|nr:hypothetical protein SKAU_G00419080 [Synaphobranchus kaupii]
MSITRKTWDNPAAWYLGSSQEALTGEGEQDISIKVKVYHDGPVRWRECGKRGLNPEGSRSLELSEQQPRSPRLFPARRGVRLQEPDSRSRDLARPAVQPEHRMAGFFAITLRRHLVQAKGATYSPARQ